tara:strand:- start:7953 stop:8963 length:1011 start_codon:yes stop_codon:yes gene_type:complete
MFYFRIDVGPKFGLGHLTRVKALIRYLKIRSYKIVIDKLFNNNFLANDKNIVCLYKNDEKFKNELSDAKLFAKLIINKKNSKVIIDSYRIGFKWEKYISKFCKKIITIDDYVDRKHYSDIYINHSPSFLNKNFFDNINLKKFNKNSCKFLLGPDYALFNSVVDKKQYNTDIVFYNGGSGNPLIYRNIINSLLKIDNNLNISLIIGPYASKYKTIINQLKEIKNLDLIIHPNNILNIINGTKIFISSAGISIFESSFLKTPTLLFKMNSNQNLNVKDYEKLGHFFCLNKNDLKLTKKISELILLMLNNLKEITKMMNSSNLKLRKIKKRYQQDLKIN